MICVLKGLAFLPKWLTVRVRSVLVGSVAIGGATSSIVESMVEDVTKGSSMGRLVTIGPLVSEGKEPKDWVSATLSTSALLE
jgi:hypothetical protein